MENFLDWVNSLLLLPCSQHQTYPLIPSSHSRSNPQHQLGIAGALLCLWLLQSLVVQVGRAPTIPAAPEFQAAIYSSTHLVLVQGTKRCELLQKTAFVVIHPC